MSPKITITKGERVLAEVEIEDPETLGLAGDAAEKKATCLLQVASKTNYPEVVARLQDLQKLADTLHQASSADSKK